jgi:hypothetical protein
MGRSGTSKSLLRVSGDVFVASTMQVSAGDQIRVTAGFRAGKNVFKNNDIAEKQKDALSGLALPKR